MEANLGDPCRGPVGREDMLVVPPAPSLESEYGQIVKTSQYQSWCSYAIVSERHSETLVLV